MRMHVCHADTGRGPAERLEEAIGGEWRPALAHENMTRPCRLIAAQLPQCANFDTTQRLDAIVTPFAPDYLQSSSFEVDLIPAQSHELADAQAVAISH